MRVLIAEDDVVSAEVLKRFLEPFGSCEIVGDGDKALVHYISGLEKGPKFDLICLDILMPNLDGISALRRIREYEESHGISGLNAVKVVMTTSVDTPNDVLNAFKTGCEGYVVKPIQKASLLRELRKLNIM